MVTGFKFSTDFNSFGSFNINYIICLNNIAYTQYIFNIKKIYKSFAITGRCALLIQLPKSDVEPRVFNCRIWMEFHLEEGVDEWNAQDGTRLDAAVSTAIDFQIVAQATDAFLDVKRYEQYFQLVDNLRVH